MDYGQWTMDNGQWTMDNGKWRMGRIGMGVSRVKIVQWSGKRAHFGRFAFV